LLKGDGTYFSITEGPESADATGYWNDMMVRDRRDVVECPFGRTVHSLLFEPSIFGGVIAFVDGGIENFLAGPSEQCWEWFLDRARLPWDCIDNPAFIWPAREGFA